MTTNPKPNVLEYAKQGNPKAIAALINKAFSKHGVAVANVNITSSLLTIELKSSQSPIDEAILQRIKDGAEKLNIKNVNQVRVTENQVKAEPKQKAINTEPVKRNPVPQAKFSNSKTTSSKKSSDKENKKSSLEKLLNRKLLLIGGGTALALVLVSVVGFTRLNKVCKVDGEFAYVKLQQFENRWDDAKELAESTSRMALSDQIKDLQNIKQEVNTVKWDDCAQPAVDSLTQSMDSTIAGFISFLDPDTSDSIIQEKFSQSDTYRIQYQQYYLDILPRKQRIIEERESAQDGAYGVLLIMSAQQSKNIFVEKELIQNGKEIEGFFDENLDKLIQEDNNYEFEIIESSESRFVATATPNKNQLKGYALGISLEEAGYDFKTVFCESEEASKEIGIPQVTDEGWSCASGSTLRASF